jgi:hypothetical protein
VSINEVGVGALEDDAAFSNVDIGKGAVRPVPALSVVKTLVSEAPDVGIERIPVVVLQPVVCLEGL